MALASSGPRRAGGVQIARTLGHRSPTSGRGALPPEEVLRSFEKAGGVAGKAPQAAQGPSPEENVEALGGRIGDAMAGPQTPQGGGTHGNVAAQALDAPPAAVPGHFKPPTADFSQIAGIGGDFQAQVQRGGDFSPGSIDTSVNPEFERILTERMKGQGIGPTFQEVVDNVYTPQAQEMERIYKQTQDQAVEEMISRGILDSREGVATMAEMAYNMSNQKAAMLGELGLRHQQMLNDSVNVALNQMGILEGNKLSAKTTITAANIQAAAQVQSASLHAGATIGAAKIGAAASLQRAQGDWALAAERNRITEDMNWLDLGMNPERMRTDPVYAGRAYKYLELRMHKQDQLDWGLQEQIIAGNIFKGDRRQ